MDNILKRNSLKTNFTWNFFGNFLYAFSQWGLIIIFTRLGDVEMVGLFSLGLALTAPIMMFTNLELRTAQSTNLNKDLDYANFFNVRIITNFIFISILIILLQLNGYELYTMLVISLVALSKIIESFSDVAYGLFQKEERMEFNSKSKILKGVFTLVIVFVLMLMFESLIISLSGLIFCWLLMFCFYDLRKVKLFNKKIELKKFDIKILKIILWTLPLGITAAIASLNTNLPRIIIENNLGVESLGYFSSIFYFVFIGDKFMKAMGHAVLPRLTKLFSEREYKKYNKIFLALNGISFIIGIFLIIFSALFGGELLSLIYGDGFAEYKNLLLLIMVFGMLNYLSFCLIVGLNSIHCFKIQSYLSIFWFLAILVLSLILIPRFGLEGAGWALIFYSFLRLITLLIVLIANIKRKKYLVL